ncbi:hypothetical protein NM688_g1969 [Phlebia brevispora]|uniref:Uncharacterized protein n=1 Tax=Phlebia brevispora TaxID=194682 RepID=A0ACC1TA70_9APHY|nr:hypothetical protein NM688_g1969 [Phlebia brevispora]
MGKFTLFHFLSEQFATLPPPLQSDLSNKTVMVTGGNAGIGFAAVRIFAELHPKKLLLGCRSEAKGRRAAELIEKETGYHGIELAIFDNGDFNSIIKFAQGFKDEPLDILVANAGVTYKAYEQTKDGWEACLQINHLSTALLSILLLPNLARTARANGTLSRLVIVSSESHFWLKFDVALLDATSLLCTLSDEKYCTPQVMDSRYAVTKLLNVLFTRALSDHLPTSVPVIPTVVNPGYCRTEIRKPISDTVLSRAGFAILDYLVGRTTEQGARQLIWAALGPDGKEGTHVKWLRGSYVSTQQIQEPSDFVMSKEGSVAQNKLWEETLQVLSRLSPDVSACYNQAPISHDVSVLVSLLPTATTVSLCSRLLCEQLVYLNYTPRNHSVINDAAEGPLTGWMARISDGNGWSFSNVLNSPLDPLSLRAMRRVRHSIAIFRSTSSVVAAVRKTVVNSARLVPHDCRGDVYLGTPRYLMPFGPIRGIERTTGWVIGRHAAELSRAFAPS